MNTKVYLAGGLRSDWASKVEGCVEGFKFFNPRDKEYVDGERIDMDVSEYGAWDFHHIRMADIVFVYVERTNPSCIGLCCEAGYAKGLGKTVITVLEPGHETIEDRYLSFITQVSDVVFSSLDAGVDYLKSFVV